MRTIKWLGQVLMGSALVLSACAEEDVVEPGELSTEQVAADESGHVGADLPIETSVEPIDGRTDTRKVALEVTAATGNWGAWSPRLLCPEGSFVNGYSLNVQESQHAEDDMGLVDITLDCINAAGVIVDTLQADPSFLVPYSSPALFVQDWGQPARCEHINGRTNFARGARLRMQTPQGEGDDTAANDMKLSCEVGSAVATNGRHTGAWSPSATCPVNTAVCGVKIRVEGFLPGFDNTALNGLRVECCETP